MDIKFYTTKSSNNTINKVLENETIFDVKFKDIASYLTPKLEIIYYKYFNFNYCYIEKFNRFYFVDSVEIKPNNYHIINLSCDVLESYKDDILNSYGEITQATNYNQYLNTNYESLITKEIDIYRSDVTLEKVDNIILATVGG